jgi:hypothetical protein
MLLDDRLIEAFDLVGIAPHPSWRLPVDGASRSLCSSVRLTGERIGIRRLPAG